MTGVPSPSRATSATCHFFACASRKAAAKRCASSNLRDVQAERRVVRVARLRRAAHRDRRGGTALVRNLPGRAGVDQAPAIKHHRLAADVQPPHGEDHCVEDDGGDERHEQQLHACRETDANHEEQVHRIYGLVEGGTKAHRGDDAGQAEREGQAVLDEEDDQGDRDRHDEQRIGERPGVAPLGPGPPVHPHDWQHDQNGDEQREDNGDRPPGFQQVDRPPNAGCRRHGLGNLFEFQGRSHALTPALGGKVVPKHRKRIEAGAEDHKEREIVGDEPDKDVLGHGDRQVSLPCANAPRRWS